MGDIPALGSGEMPAYIDVWCAWLSYQSDKKLDAELTELNRQCAYDDWVNETVYGGYPPPDFIKKLGITFSEERINAEGKWEKFVFHEGRWRRVPSWKCDQKSYMSEGWKEGTKWEIVNGIWEKFMRKEVWEKVERK